jgi:sodium transport system permease protein
MIRAALEVFAKEAVDGLRDRRSLVAALLYSFLGPLAVGVALDSLARRETREAPPEIAVSGSERAPSLVRFLESRGAVVIEAPADPSAAVRAGDLDVALVVPEAYPKEFRAGRPAEIRILYDSSRRGAKARLDRTRGLLAEYGAQVRTQRLLARGLSPEAAAPVAAAEQDLASAASRAALALAMLPIFLLVAAFVGGMNVAIDGTAGERERGSLGPLLLCPVPAGSVALGKGLAVTLFGLLGVVMTLMFTLIVLGAAPAAAPGRGGLEPAELPLLLAVLAPLAPLAGSLQMLVATLCRSYKEAQTYLSLLLLAPMVPGFATAFYGIEPAAGWSVVPVLGQQLLLERVLRGEAPGAGLPAAAGLAALGAAALCVRATGRLLGSEHIVFGR